MTGPASPHSCGPIARYFACEDHSNRSYLRASGFGPHDPPHRVVDRRTGKTVEHGFRLEDTAIAYAEALNRVAESGRLPGD
jgi:hypothetical protein